MAIQINGNGTITGISAGGLPAGTVTSATLASGAGGKILQVIQETSTSYIAIDSTSYMATNLSATITPSSTSSKILINTTQVTDTEEDSRQVYIALFRSIGGGTYSNLIGGSEGAFGGDYSADGRQISTSGIMFLDSPNTTSAITYKSQFNNNSASGTVYCNADDSSSYERSRGSIIVMEIAQ